jgi:hypothetical protein
MTQNQERCLFHTYLCVAVFSLQDHERMYSPYQQLQEDPPMQSTMCLFCNKDAVSGCTRCILREFSNDLLILQS